MSEKESREHLSYPLLSIQRTDLLPADSLMLVVGGGGGSARSNQQLIPRARLACVLLLWMNCSIRASPCGLWILVFAQPLVACYGICRPRFEKAERGEAFRGFVHDANVVWA